MQQLIQRNCSDCGSVKTSLTKAGFPKWYSLDKDKSKLVCAKCYNKIYNIRYIRFKDKRIPFDSNPRTGTCSNCGKSIAKDEIKKTDIHHDKYDPENPKAHTRELCVGCHNRMRIIERTGQ